MDNFSTEEFCASIDFLNTFHCFQNKKIKTFHDLLDGWHISQILLQIDGLFFEEVFEQKGFKLQSVETIGEQKQNLKILVEAVADYYNEKLGIDIKSQVVIQVMKGGDVNDLSASNSDHNKLLFFNIDKLIQTENNFKEGSCEVMMQFCVFVFALILNNEALKDDYIEQIMGLNEDVQEALTNIIQYSMDLIGNTTQVLNESNRSIQLNDNSIEDQSSMLMIGKQKSSDLKQNMHDLQSKVEELQSHLMNAENDSRHYKESLLTYEDENKKLQAQLLDERLAKEEAMQQIETYDETFKNTERVSKDKKKMEQTAIKQLELDNDTKQLLVSDLKAKMKDLEIKSIQNENVLRDEIDLLKDKNNKHLQNEAALEIYKNKLKEIPELKNKLRQALQDNVDLQAQLGDGNEDSSQIQTLQDCIKILKVQITKLQDENSEKEIQIVRFDNDLKDKDRQKNHLENTIKALNKNLDEYQANLSNSARGGKRGTSIGGINIKTPTDGNDDDDDASGLVQEYQLLQLENNTLNSKIKALEKEKDKFIQNEFNPEFLKLQSDFNDKEREVTYLNSEIDRLQQKINDINDTKLALQISKQGSAKKHRMGGMDTKGGNDIINESYDEANVEASFNFEEDRNSLGSNDGLGFEDDSALVQQLQEQIMDLTQQVQDKFKQNKQIREKLEMYQEKFNKALQDKTDMHEMYLAEKQSVLEAKQEISSLQSSSGSKSNFRDARTADQQQKLEKELFETKEKLQARLDNEQNIETKLSQAVIRMESQRDMIKNLKLEQRVMAGVLHRVGAEYCFTTGGEYDRRNVQRNAGQLPNQ